MTASAAPWSTDGQQRLREGLTGYWAEDTWDLFALPLLAEPIERREVPAGIRYLRFRCKSNGLNLELKYACWRKLQDDWQVSHLLWVASFLHLIMAWLDRVARPPRVCWSTSATGGCCRCGHTSPSEVTAPRVGSASSSPMSRCR